jgi:glycosyltransferase involved in cell wall biosynthesis
MSQQHPAASQRLTRLACKILLADPVMVAHSLLYYEAALASAGFEDAKFTIVTATRREDYRQRALEFFADKKNVTFRLLDVDPGPCVGRLQLWRGFARSMRAVEKLLRAERFDLVAYLSLDPLLLYFALPGFKRRFPAHFSAGVSGTLFRDNGLRPVLVNSVKANLRKLTDLWVLRRALANPALRKVAFLDHRCADRARATLNSSKCGYGVDPVFPVACDEAAARTSFGLKPGDFVILLFGVLSERKGVLETLQMLRLAELPKNTVIILAGPAEEEIRAPLKNELTLTANQYRLIRHDRFISRAETPPYFAAADCVICIYKEFSGSSSVLLHAAMYGKPAIVSPGGAMANAVTRHQFGEVVDLSNCAGFCDAITRVSRLTASERAELANRAREYASVMDAQRYMSQFHSVSIPEAGSTSAEVEFTPQSSQLSE